MSKSWADVEDEFPPSPPSKPQPAPPLAPKLASAESSGPSKQVYLKMNRFTEPAATASSSAPRPSFRGASDRGLWEPASGNGGFPGFEASRGGSRSGAAKPKPSQITATKGRFELQLKNVPSELAPDEVLQAEVRRVFEGLTLGKIKRNAKSQLVFLEVNSKQAMEDALCRLLPEGWELKPVATKDKSKPQAAKPPAATPAANAPPKPAKKPQSAAKKEEVKKPASNKFGALYNDSDSSSSEGGEEEQEE